MPVCPCMFIGMDGLTDLWMDYFQLNVGSRFPTDTINVYNLLVAFGKEWSDESPFVNHAKSHAPKSITVLRSSCQIKQSIGMPKMFFSMSIAYREKLYYISSITSPCHWVTRLHVLATYWVQDVMTFHLIYQPSLKEHVTHVNKQLNRTLLIWQLSLGWTITQKLDHPWSTWSLYQ